MKKVLDGFKKLSLKWKLTILFFIYTIVSSLIAYFNLHLFDYILSSLYVSMIFLGFLGPMVDYYFLDNIFISELLIISFSLVYSYFISYVVIFFIDRFSLKLNKFISKVFIFIIFIILSWLIVFLFYPLVGFIDPFYFIK